MQCVNVLACVHSAVCGVLGVCSICVCVCVHACVHVCIHACVRACARAHVCEYAGVCLCVHTVIMHI